MGSTSIPEVVFFDYQFAPNAQKARNLLNVMGVPFTCCEQPFVLPRPDLTDIGITYRRVPVVAIGKDLFCDNRPLVENALRIWKDKAIPTSPADHAYESFGYRTFWTCLQLVDAKLISPEMAKDRSSLFAIFSRSDYGDLKQSALGELKQWMDIVEHDFLAHGKQFIGGDKVGVADIHSSWMLKWAMQTLDLQKEPGFSAKDFPKFHNWINGLSDHTPENDVPKLKAKEAHEKILNSDYAVPSLGVAEGDPTGLKKGQDVVVVTNDDSRPEDHPQKGKLDGLSNREIVIQLENGLRVHFPRIGIYVRAA